MKEHNCTNVFEYTGVQKNDSWCPVQSRTKISNFRESVSRSTGKNIQRHQMKTFKKQEKQQTGMMLNDNYNHRKTASIWNQSPPSKTAKKFVIHHSWRVRWVAFTYLAHGIHPWSWRSWRIRIPPRPPTEKLNGPYRSYHERRMMNNKNTVL